MHKYTLPAEELSHFVKRIYEIDIGQPSTFDDNRIIPLGTGVITFVLQGNPRVESAAGVRKFPRYALSGQYFPTFSFDSDIPLLFYGIALKPTATLKLFNMYLADIQNSFIPLNEVIGDQAGQVLQKLRKADSTEGRFSILTDFILQLRPDATQYTHLDVLVDLIYQRQGMLKVKDLCEHEDVSRRYLEKRFKKVIGFTPGQFIRQVRFNFTCSKIAEGKAPVNDILMEFGYYDRSHFMKKFRKYFGNDLSVLTGDQDNLFKVVFSRIMRSDAENSYHP